MFQLLWITWCIAIVNYYVLFPGIIIVILASLAVHRLTLIVYVHVVVWGGVSCRWGYGGHGSTTVLSTEGSAVQ